MIPPRPAHALRRLAAGWTPLARLLACLLPLVATLRADDDALVEVVRAVARERVESAEKVGETAAAEILRAELALPLSSAPTEPAPAEISAVRPPAESEDNPYIALMADGARAYLAKPEGADAWPKLRPGQVDFLGLRTTGDDKDCRGTARRMETLLWLFANPASPLRGDPAVLRAFLRRAHAYADAIEIAGSAVKPGKGLYDDFAIGPAACALREFAALHPGLLLPSQRAAWDRAMRIAANVMMTKAVDFNGRYANIDLALSFELLNFGLHLRDEALLAKSRALFSAQADNILPDGGTHYIWSQNESPGYHDTVAMFISRTHEITRDEAALAMLRRLEWYGPVSVGRLGEYWTAPSWKHTWNGGEFATGGEVVVALTRNPFVRGMLAPPAAKAPWRGWESVRGQVAWWTPGIPSRELPDHYTILDRNIAGPRAWYGRFNYAATLRDIPVSEPGHATLVGAQLTGPDHARGALLMGVCPRLYLGGDRSNPRSFASLTSDMRSDLAMGREWSAFAADYQLHVFGSSTKGKLVPWRGRQLWLGLSDRLVGVLEIAPESPATPKAAVEGLVRLGIGGTVSGPAQKLVARDDAHYAFGDLAVIVHGSDFGQRSTESTPFRLPRAPCSDIVLRDAAPVSASRRFVVEIRPAAATEAKVNYDPAAQMLRVGIGERIFFVTRESAAGPKSAPRVRVKVESPEEADHAPAWRDFAALAAQNFRSFP